VASFDWADVDESCFDTWHLMANGGGATWPRHGLPRGTMLKVGLLKLFMESMGIEPQTSPHGGKRFGKGHPTNAPHLFLVIYMF
jgi:hypothetical protein